MIDGHDLVNWHEPAPRRALITGACISACIVLAGIGGLVMLAAKWGWL